MSEPERTGLLQLLGKGTGLDIVINDLKILMIVMSSIWF